MCFANIEKSIMIGESYPLKSSFNALVCLFTDLTINCVYFLACPCCFDLYLGNSMYKKVINRQAKHNSEYKNVILPPPPVTVYSWLAIQIKNKVLKSSTLRNSLCIHKIKLQLTIIYCTSCCIIGTFKCSVCKKLL